MRTFLRVSLIGSWLGVTLGLLSTHALIASASSASSSLPSRYQRAPLDKMSLSLGRPNAGSQLRAKRLRPSATIAILEKSKDSVHGHPALVLMLERSAKQIAKQFRGSRLAVGDLSAPQGGALPGHHSHQSGRDADVAFYARDKKGRMVVPSAYVAFGADGKAKDGSGLVFDDERNWALVEAWTRDDRAGLAYIFVSRGLKTRLLAHGGRNPKNARAVARARALFVQPDHAEPHDDHFHVRIRCPEGQADVCKEASR